MPSLATMISSSSRCETLRYSRTGNWMFCRTVSEENSAPCWNRMPQRRSTPRRSAVLAASRSTPNTSMRPATFGTRPMMVRVSTDLPAPDGPTKPRISPRLTSRLSPSSTRVVPNCTVMSRTRMMASEISPRHAHIPIDAKKMANTPSMTMTRKIPFTTDDVVCWPSDSALPCTASPSTQATMPITAAITGALMMPTMK